jgi:hypothetical protein
MVKQKDDLEAVRTLVGVLQPFDAALQRRIVRWAAEKLDLSLPFGSEAIPDVLPQRRVAPPVRGPRPRHSASAGSGLKAFVAAKRPRNDTELAATLAYFARSVAQAGKRKPGINVSDLLAACAALGRKRPPVPGQTLRNARAAGVLMSQQPGVFAVSPAGEKLVLRTLPHDGQTPGKPARRRRRRVVKTTARRTSQAQRRGRKRGVKS